MIIQQDDYTMLLKDMKQMQFILLTITLFTLTLTCESATYADPVGNLIGNSERGFVDIETIEFNQESDLTRIRILFAANFPTPFELLGTGMQISYTFLRHPDIRNEDSPTIYLELGSDGWQKKYQNKQFPDVDPTIDYSINPNELTIEFPNTLAQEFNYLSILSSTENYPKWKPITSNPVITIPISEEIPVSNARAR